MTTATGQEIAAALKTDPFWIDPAVADQLNPALLEKAKTTAEGLDFPSTSSPSMTSRSTVSCFSRSRSSTAVRAPSS